MRLVGRILGFLFRTLGRVTYFALAAIGFVVVLLVAVLALFGASTVEVVRERAVSSVPEAVVLVADWRGGVAEKTRLGPFGAFAFDGTPALPQVLAALERAAGDERVQGLVVRTDGTGFGAARAWELREAVQRLRDAGKFTAIYADTFGELQGGMVATYLAAAFEHVQLQPLGTLGLTGLASERPYFGRLLDELDITRQVVKREEFKSALEPFTREAPSPASAAELDRLLDGLFATFVDGIAAARELDAAAVRVAVDRGPLLGEAAMERNLVDAIGHEPALWETVETATGTSERLDLARYAALGDARDPQVVIGFVHAVGAITRGESDEPFDALEIAADTTAEAIDAARAAEVDALLLRVSSPGGSAVASETIAAAVRRAKSDGIPVIVSMGDVAASGGYWISMDADRILAAPVTLTGSIGVITGKPAVGALLDELGVDVAREQRGANADLGSIYVPWDERGRERIEALVDDLYLNFLEGVAVGRNMDVAAVRAVAGGRVWLGAEAIENGLVDEAGGLLQAIAAARAAAGVAPDAPVELRPFPRPSPPFRLALAEFGRFLQVATDLRRDWRALTAAPTLRFEAPALPRAE